MRAWQQVPCQRLGISHLLFLIPKKQQSCWSWWLSPKLYYLYLYSSVKAVEIVIVNIQNCTYLSYVHIRHAHFFVPEAKIIPPLRYLPSDPSHHSQHGEGKTAQPAQIQIDRSTFVTHWIMFLCKKKKKGEGDKSSFDRGECRVSALTPQRGGMHWSLRLYRPSWSQNWTPNYLFDPFMRVTLL